MTLFVDPEGIELLKLNETVDLDDKRVLEIGCGEGRLCERYADRTALSVGIDLDIGFDLAEFSGTSCFSSACATALPFADDAFDVALFGWSL